VVRVSKVRVTLEDTLDMKSILIFAISLLLLLAMNPVAFAGGGKASDEKASATTISSAAPSAISAEVIALRAQNEMLRLYSDKILATVYWALGAIAGVIVLVVGLGWYTNFRLYKKDLSGLENEMKSIIRSGLDSIQAKSLQHAAGSAESAVRIAIRNLKSMEFQLRTMNARQLTKDGYFGNALLEYANALADDVNALPEYKITEILESMVELLKNNKAKMALHSGTLSTAIRVLDKLPSQYATDVEAIKTILREVRLSES
jgi:hypothetical protein